MSVGKHRRVANFNLLNSRRKDTILTFGDTNPFDLLLYYRHAITAYNRPITDYVLHATFAALRYTHIITVLTS